MSSFVNFYMLCTPIRQDHYPGGITESRGPFRAITFPFAQIDSLIYLCTFLFLNTWVASNRLSL